MIASKCFIYNKKFFKVILKKVNHMYNVYVSDLALYDGELYYSSANITFATQVFNSI